VEDRDLDIDLDDRNSTNPIVNTSGEVSEVVWHVVVWVKSQDHC